MAYKVSGNPRVMRPTLSVTMTNYNHAHFIADALDAILEQSYQPLEIIIIDDASTDDSYDIIQSYAREYPIVTALRNDVNMGVLHNAIRLSGLARGDYLYGAAADDKVLPGFFKKSMELLARYPQAGLCSSLSRCISEDGGDRGILHMPRASNQDCFIAKERAMGLLRKHGSWIQGNTTIFRRCALVECGGFIPELKSFCDGFMHMVIAAKYGVCYIPEALAAWRQVGNSYSATINRAPESSLQCIRHAKELMCSTYRDLFPPDFVESWERRELLNNKLARFNDLQTVALDDLKEMIPSRGMMDHFLFGLGGLARKMEYALLKLYLYHRNGLSSNQLLIQRLRAFRRVYSRRN